MPSEPTSTETDAPFAFQALAVKYRRIGSDCPWGRNHETDFLGFARSDLSKRDR